MERNEGARVPLVVLGLSGSEIRSGAYALLLREERGARCIPVVIGSLEAQALVVILEGLHTPRPLTHDLFVSFAHAFGVKLKSAFLYRFEDGIFSAELTFSDGERTVSLDTRTSDAIAIALRTGTPIYTTPEILEQTGILIANEEGVMEMDELDDDDEEFDDLYEQDGERHPDRRGYHAEPRPENYTIEQLESTLAELIEKENYEEAERISQILKRKRDARDTNI